MQSIHPIGKPVTVFNFSADSDDPTVKEQLSKMFDHPDIKASKIVAFSVVGPYRKGKSFFLNYCLRFLYAHYPSINFSENPLSNPKGWMELDDEPLVGFSWRSGSDPDTTGIAIWNDVFMHTDENGEKTGIVVIDTQGLFNRDSSQTDNSRIFALGTIISSIQVFNLSGVVQEDQLQYLQFAAGYAKFALSNEVDDEKPFQKLLFLIRDWDNPQEYPFGCVGGEKYLRRFFNSKSDKTDELKSVYEYINNLYQDLSCSLLPNPGKIVSQGIFKNQNEKYDGSLKGMEEDFKEELSKVIEQILSPEKLVAKRFNGTYLNGAEFLGHMQKYFKFFLTNEAPEVQTVLESVVENEMKALVQQCVDKYKNEYRKLQSSLVNLKQMQDHHEHCKANALALFDESDKMCNPEDEVIHKDELVAKIDGIHHEHVNQFEANERKIKEENNKIRIELDMKHKKELEELRSKLDARKKENEMKLQKMKDEFEQKKKMFAEELTCVKMQTEKEQEIFRSSLNDGKRHEQHSIVSSLPVDSSCMPNTSQFHQKKILPTSHHKEPRTSYIYDDSDSRQSSQTMQNLRPSSTQYKDNSLQPQIYHNQSSNFDHDTNFHSNQNSMNWQQSDGFYPFEHDSKHQFVSNDGSLKRENTPSRTHFQSKQMLECQPQKNSHKYQNQYNYEAEELVAAPASCFQPNNPQKEIPFNHNFNRNHCQCCKGKCEIETYNPKYVQAQGFSNNNHASYGGNQNFFDGHKAEQRNSEQNVAFGRQSSMPPNDNDLKRQNSIVCSNKPNVNNYLDSRDAEFERKKKENEKKLEESERRITDLRNKLINPVTIDEQGLELTEDCLQRREDSSQEPPGRIKRAAIYLKSKFNSIFYRCQDTV